MITEVIKRGHRKGYDENGTLVYKIPVEESSPIPLVEEEELAQEDEEVAPTFPFTAGE